VEAGTDEFKFEKEALEIEGKLSAMLRRRELPLASDFTGASLMPRRYRTIAPGVSEAEFGAEGAFQVGLARWIQSLGNIRRAGFFILPENVVRYEIASDGAYRVGFWKQVWAAGKLREFHPLSETLVTAQEPLFQDITGHSFGGVDSYSRQLLKGNVWWRSRLD